MKPDQVSDLVESLPQVKRKGTSAKPAWYLHDRLLARLVEAIELAWEMQRR